MDRDQENRLVTSCQHGDRRALETLVRQYQKPVFNAAYRMLGDTEQAADVTQATFLKALEKIQGFDTKHRFFSWIYRIALNESIDQLKRGRRFQPYTDAQDADSNRPPQQAARSETVDQVQAALMTLNEDMRSVLVLRYFSDCSYQEIGKILDLPDKTVKSRLFSARQKLKITLEERGVTSL